MIGRARPRSICFVMPFHIMERRGGGAEVQAWLLARELARRGHEVHYVAQSVRGKQGTSETVDGVRIHWLRYRALFAWLDAAQWYAALRRIDPDLIVQRMTSPITGVIGLYARLYKRPFAWICTEDLVPNRWFFWRNQKRMNRILAPGPLKGTVLLADACFRDLWRQFGMRYATHAFVQNERQRCELKESFGLEAHHMPSGHELPAAGRLDAEDRRRNGVVLWVGNMGARKRPGLFVDLARRHTEAGRRFVMVGDHCDAEWLQSTLGDLPPNLERKGRLSFEDALAWFDRAAVLVNTSDREGFPNTFIQAWLRGVPVLSLCIDPDRVLTRERLGDVTGDVDGLARSLRDLLEDPRGYAETSWRCADHARATYTVDRVADTFLEAVRSS